MQTARPGRGIAPTSGAAVWENMNIHRIADGRIAEQWCQYATY